MCEVTPDLEVEFFLGVWGWVTLAVTCEVAIQVLEIMPRNVDMKFLRCMDFRV
jgi:hypothetical protein